MEGPDDLENDFEEEYDDEATPLLSLKNPQNYFSALEAVHFLSATLGGDTAAKSIIAERLRDGALRSFSRWLLREADHGDVVESFPALGSRVRSNLIGRPSFPKIEGELIELDRAFWSSSTDWSSNQQRWKWGAGLFVTNHVEWVSASLGRTRSSLKLTPFRRVAGGVHFDRVEIENMKFTDPKLKKSGAKRGRSHDSVMWGAWLAEVIFYDIDVGIDENMSANALVEITVGSLAARGININNSSVHPVAQQILERLRERTPQRIAGNCKKLQ